MKAGTVIRGSAVLCAILLTLLGAVTTASAEELRYGYVEGGWAREDIDELDKEDGYFAGGSFSLRRFFFFGEWRDPGEFEVWEAGAGWAGLFGDKFDLVIKASYIDYDFDEGYHAAGGVRWLLLDDLEVNAFYHHVDAGDFENDSVSVGGLWEFLGRMAVGGEYQFGDEADTARAFLRVYFKKD